MTLLIGNTFYARNIVASVLVMVWAARLAGETVMWMIYLSIISPYVILGFLLFRVLKMGSDSRFDEIRSHFFKFMGKTIFRDIRAWRNN